MFELESFASFANTTRLHYRQKEMEGWESGIKVETSEVFLTERIMVSCEKWSLQRVPSLIRCSEWRALYHGLEE